MQFALLVYESPEAFATRKNNEIDAYTGAWRAYYKALVESGATSAPMHLKCPRREQPCALGKESAACRMDPTRTPRSSSQDSSSWNSLPLTLLSNGRRDAREHRSAPWKSGRWHRSHAPGFTG